MQLLAEAVDTYEATKLARWWEWEAASEGRRQLTWSGGTRSLRDLAALGSPSTDEEVAGDTLSGEQSIQVGPRVWARVVHERLEADVLRLIERLQVHPRPGDRHQALESDLITLRAALTAGEVIVSGEDLHLASRLLTWATTRPSQS